MTPFGPTNLGTVPEQSHVTASTGIYTQANASVDQYAVGHYWDTNATTGYQINQYVPSSNNGASVSYGANSYYPSGVSNVGNYCISNLGTTVDQSWGGVQKFFQNPEQVTDSALLEKGIKSYRKFGGPVPSSYQLDSGNASFSMGT